jgi:hypothetical protein
MQTATIVITDLDGKTRSLEPVRDKDAMWRIGAAMIRAGFKVIAGREDWSSFTVTVVAEPEEVEAMPPLVDPAA